MGYYLNKDMNGKNLPALGKMQALVRSGATPISGEEFVENMVCVIDNMVFDAAAYMYSREEYEYFKKMPNVICFLIVPNAKELSNFS